MAAASSQVSGTDYPTRHCVRLSSDFTGWQKKVSVIDVYGEYSVQTTQTQNQFLFVEIKYNRYVITIKYNRSYNTDFV